MKMVIDSLHSVDEAVDAEVGACGAKHTDIGLTLQTVPVRGLSKGEPIALYASGRE